MSDVFISYKAEDRRRVQPLVLALQADGLSVWWDEHIGAGDAWRETIEQQLDSAGCVVVIWSKRSVGPDGKFVREEASRAQRRGAYVPVLIDAVDPPLGFGESQATSLRGWHGNANDPHYQAVVAAIRRNVGGGRRRSRPSRPLPNANIDRRTVIAGGAVATAAIAGAGGWALLRSSSASASGSIAVLPFANLSGDPSQAYFSDGIAEEIRSALARIAGLKVVGRTSSEAVRNSDAETAAKKLSVANILTGSVRQSPSTIRVTAELIDGSSGIDRWSQDYDRSPGDSIKIQSDIAENVATALSTALGSAARAAITIGGTSNVEAQRLLLQGSEAANTNSKQAYLRALSLFDAAIALDPNYADAFARKALYLELYADTYANGLAELSDYRSRALQAARTAMRLAPGLARAHVAMAIIHQGTLNLAPAAAEYQRALELAPGDARIVGQYAALVGRFGHVSEALRLADQAVALDPISADSYRIRFMTLFGSRRYGEAVAFAQQLQKKAPQLFDWPAVVGQALVFLNRFDEAQSYFGLAPDDNYRRLVGEAHLLVRTGRQAEVPAKIAKLRQHYGDAASYQYGEVYAQLGDKERAFAGLDRAWEIRDSGLLNLKVDAYMDPIRGEPRYAAMVKKLNFPA
jgi:serine/threonine-protein kinase